MCAKPSMDYFYRCFSDSSAGDLICGLKRVGPPLSKSDLLDHFKHHKNLKNRRYTALVSVSDRPIEALHRAFAKYYNLGDLPSNIWIAIIGVPVPGNGRKPYHHAEELAFELDLGIEESRKLRHEFLFEWEIPVQYVEHRVSLETLIGRGLNIDDYLENGRLPNLSKLRNSMIDMILSPPLDGYAVGRELGRMARCFGARAPVQDIANKLLTDCPSCISVNQEMQYVKWRIEDPETDKYIFQYVDFEHFYWITRGINEALFDCWLCDDTFLEHSLAHAERANNLTNEMEILWELYWENIFYEVWTGINSNSAADEAHEQQMREHEIHELIEKEAVSIGL